MSDFHPAGGEEAHPARDEYVLERHIGDGRWVVDSIFPAATPEEAEAHGTAPLQWTDGDTLRVVRRVITSTVIAVRPGTAWPDEGSAA